MRFTRDFPPAPLAAWHAALVGVDARHGLRPARGGRVLRPGLWVDRWHVVRRRVGRPARFVFTHALTPVDETTTRHVWRVSRNFAPTPAATGTLAPLFGRYYRTVQAALETMQRIVTEDGPRPEVSVSADAAATAVRRIIDRLVADETGSR